ncbi:MAG: K+/H+ antiporter subunit F [Ottowia sp.]|uniref:K+/H+ antiporter subunit F n=1 Tax=Ottowia sp. TaxID=1898956 RepID=UPI001D49D911|nr:K+/H+ antiporter subunit F [Ottowia sp.]MCP5257576.1 K+/H+ antiporter subunit F [Burkholderiaceae bacterium]MCB2026620.1 K+/H+ antiporter subunit F [Ottowia sp.]MCB2070892.1 K+/H+ antiporter subunit F [Ottowia sp.]HPR44154.1 K+/H+ antiporter subunit F [Ottowia sp.]HRW74029.1 K+/H+ antiporter subunit F [Ottowia sp.]
MSPFLEVVIRITMLGYGVAMLLALWRALRGPTAQDRVLAVDFITIVAMLLMLVVGIRYASSMYLEAALLLALFGFVSSAAFAKYLLRGEIIE